MPNTLISGPAGAGKNQGSPVTCWARCKGRALSWTSKPSMRPCCCSYVGRMGRYPERDPSDAHLLALAEYTRRAMITGAQEMDIEIIATNSDGSPARREYLRGLLGAGAVETVLDPGRSVVEGRLAGSHELSHQCRQAVDRWSRIGPTGGCNG